MKKPKNKLNRELNNVNNVEIPEGSVAGRKYYAKGKPTGSSRSDKPDKRMPLWGLIITDVLLTGICLCLFALYHHVLPRHLAEEEIVVATAVEGEDTTFRLPDNKEGDNDISPSDSSSDPTSDSTTDLSSNTSSDGSSDAVPDPSSSSSSDTTSITQSDKTSDTATGNPSDNEADITADSTITAISATTAADNTATNQEASQSKNDKNAGKTPDGGYINYGNSDTTDIYAEESESDYIISGDKTITEVNNYKSDHIQFSTDKVEIGNGSNKITYYVSDIYITNVKYLKTAFAYGEYGKNFKESTLEMALDNNALLAINGDYYGNNEVGVVIRNGVQYRSEVYDADLCVLYTDGTMETYSPDEFNLNSVIEKRAWQAWIFGPELLDGQGNILAKFNSTYYLSNAHPRTAIGYVEPGHYVFTLVDGRDEGYSRGVTLTELAQIMKDAGCVTAYNLDGGKSSEMVYKDDFVNKPWEGGRSVSDIIYIGE